MRSFFYLLTAAAVMGLAFWAYQQNYRTQQALKDMRAVRGEIAQMRESLNVLRAEWAYLNRPDRLRDLALLNDVRLGLQPIDAAQFDGIDRVAYPEPAPSDLPQITRTYDVMGTTEEVQ